MSIYLRELTRKDIETIHLWRCDKDLIDQLGTNYRFINIETDEQWFEQYLKNRVNQIRCAIIEEERDQFIGVVYLLNIDYINRSGELSIFIADEKNRGKKYGYSAVVKMLEHGFLNINLNRIYLTVLEENARAISTYIKCGFRDEGIMRQSLYKNGVYKSMKIMSVLKEEFI